MKRTQQIEGMSGKPPADKPKPQAPIKLGKVKVTFVPRAKAVVEDTTASSLTVLPSDSATKPEDQGPAPTY